MTKEEAIADLKEALKEVDMFRKIYLKQRKVSVEYEKRYASLSFAIKALEEQQSEDYINRTDTINYIQGHIHEIISESGIDKNEHTNRVIRAIIKGIEKLPSGRSVNK